MKQERPIFRDLKDTSGKTLTQIKEEEKLTVRFSCNWNKKLYCKCFSTLRKPSEKYVLGQEYTIMLNNDVLCKAKIVYMKEGDTDTITEEMCYLDTGFNSEETKEYLKEVYRGELPSTLLFIVFQTTIIYPGARQLLFLDECKKLVENYAQSAH